MQRETPRQLNRASVLMTGPQVVSHLYGNRMIRPGFEDEQQITVPQIGINIWIVIPSRIRRGVLF